MLEPVAVIVPVLGRPGNVAPLVESYLASGARGALYFVADCDDQDELDAIAAVEGDRVHAIVTEPPLVTFPRKVNLAYRRTTEPWLLLVGDDVTFRKGWSWKAQLAAGSRFHLIATEDHMSRRVAHGVHATHPMIRRTWIDEAGASWDGPGTVAHEGYRHWFVDDEWSTKARADGVFVHAPHAVVRHHSPLDPDTDPVYRAAWDQRNRDQRLYHERLARFVPTASVGRLPA